MKCLKFSGKSVGQVSSLNSSLVGSGKVLAMLTITLTSACGITSEFKDKKMDKDAERKEVEERQLQKGEPLHLTLPTSVADDKSAPLKVPPGMKKILDESLKDKVIQFSCDKDTGKVKGYVYMALFQRRTSSGQSDDFLREIAFGTPDQLKYEEPIMKEPAKAPEADGSGSTSTSPSIGIAYEVSTGMPQVGAFGISVAVPKDFDWEKKSPQKIDPLFGHGILVPYTCDLTSKISLTLRTNGMQIYNLYARVYTPSGKATHEALSKAFGASVSGVNLNLKPINSQVEVVVKNP